jgi:uncharacterized protein with HEPN domain
MQRDSATLLDIARAAGLVLEFTRDMDRAAFTRDAKSVSAVLHQVTVIGEAVERLSPEFREAHPDVPWRRIAGMRDKLIHGNDQADIEEVWKTATRDVPELLAYIKPLAPNP